MVEHTPGPWRASTTNGHWYVNDDQTHLDVFIMAEANDNPEADAHLIAAAPDLLAVVERLPDTTPADLYKTDLIEHARAAIAKAKGEA